MNAVRDRLRGRALAAPRRIVLPEADDERILVAATAAAAEGLCHPLLVGDREAIARRRRGLGLVGDAEVIDPREAERWSSAIAHLESRLTARGVAKEERERRRRDPAHLACALVGCGAADGAVMGAVTATADSSSSRPVS